MSVVEQLQRMRRPARYNIAKLVGKLRKQSPVRLWLESNAEIAEGSADGLFTAFAGTNASAWADRAVVLHVLGLMDLSPSDGEKARHLLLDALKQPDVDRVSLGRFARTMGVAFLGWLTVTVVFSIPMDAFLGIPVILLLMVLLVIQEKNWAAITRRVAATALAQLGNLECIVGLCEHVLRPTVILDEAIEALKAILPLVTADWYGRLPPGSNTALVDLARARCPHYDEDLALAALKALEQAGDGSCANDIARITVRNATYRVYKLAGTVWPVLAARREREEESASLLRPSAPNMTEDLLRPVYGGDPNVTNLLRASHADSPTTPRDDNQS